MLGNQYFDGTGVTNFFFSTNGTSTMSLCHLIWNCDCEIKFAYNLVVLEETHRKEGFLFYIFLHSIEWVLRGGLFMHTNFWEGRYVSFSVCRWILTDMTNWQLRGLRFVSNKKNISEKYNFISRKFNIRKTYIWKTLFQMTSIPL